MDRNKKHAQSILELIAMIMFVAATIVIGGPTIIRGLNAHFKIWDDSVQDTYNDPLMQGPQQNMPGNCVCDDPLDSPGVRCNVAPCGPTEHLATVLCNPVGCGEANGIPENYCVPDSLCCDAYIDTDDCGLGTNNPQDCPLGQRITRRNCGENTTQYSCRVDNDPIPTDGNPTCIPHCIGAYNDNEVSFLANPNLPIICPDDDTNIAQSAGPFKRDPSGVGIDLEVIAGGDITSCLNNPRKCQAYFPACQPREITPANPGCGPVTLPNTFSGTNREVYCAGDCSGSVTGTCLATNYTNVAENCTPCTIDRNSYGAPTVITNPAPFYSLDNVRFYSGGAWSNGSSGDYFRYIIGIDFKTCTLACNRRCYGSQTQFYNGADPRCWNLLNCN